MTDEQFEKTKKYYESCNKGKKFESLRLYQMNEWLYKTILAKSKEMKRVKKK